MAVHDTSVESVVEHLAVDFVHTTSNWLYQSASSYHGIKLQRYSGLFEFVEYQLTAEILLLDDIAEGCQLFCRV